jgi:hypothetical protein
VCVLSCLLVVMLASNSFAICSCKGLSESIRFYLHTRIATITRPMTPMIIIIWKHKNRCSHCLRSRGTLRALTFRFCSQNFLLSFPACCSNCEAPCCNASERCHTSFTHFSKLDRRFVLFIMQHRIMLTRSVVEF